MQTADASKVSARAKKRGTAEVKIINTIIVLYHNN